MNEPIKLANEEPSEKFPLHPLNESWGGSNGPAVNRDCGDGATAASKWSPN